MGLEVAPFGLNFGSVEEVKDILLASNQMFCAEHTLELANADNRFSPSNPASIFYGRNILLAPVVLSQGGALLFQGFLTDISLDHASRKVRLVSQNAFTLCANYFVNLTTSGNPAAIIRTILEQAGLSNYIDEISFNAAQGGFAAAAATIGVKYVTTGAVGTAQGISGTTALSAIQAISSLCGLSCFVQAGLIRLKAFQAYQGNLSAVKWQIGPDQVYDFKEMGYAKANLSNSVNVGYGASSNYYAANQVSIRANSYGFGAFTPAAGPNGKRSGEVNTQFDGTTGNDLTVPNLTSAQYFAKQFLARASTLRRTAGLVCGPQLLQAHIGDRCTIMAPNWGPAPIACEILETHIELASNSVELLVATI